jgi:hypothetical protein
MSCYTFIGTHRPPGRSIVSLPLSVCAHSSRICRSCREIQLEVAKVLAQREIFDAGDEVGGFRDGEADSDKIVEACDTEVSEPPSSVEVHHEGPERLHRGGAEEGDGELRVRCPVEVSEVAGWKIVTGRPLRVQLCGQLQLAQPLHSLQVDRARESRKTSAITSYRESRRRAGRTKGRQAIISLKASGAKSMSSTSSMLVQVRRMWTRERAARLVEIDE